MHACIIPDFPDEDDTPIPTPDPFPTTLIAATTVIVAIAVVGAAFLIYFRKIKKKREVSDLHP